jgi:DNA-binding XRE family transcriptional regulator
MSYQMTSISAHSPTAADIVAGGFLDLGRDDRIAWNGMPVRSSTQESKREARRPTNLQRLREEQLLTKAELARKAGVSALTVARIESGLDCRVDTKRKIILALGLQPTDKAKVFGGGPGRRSGRFF